MPAVIDAEPTVRQKSGPDTAGTAGPTPMRIAEVIGRVTLCRAHPALVGAKYVIGVPLSVAGIQGSPEGRGEPIVIYDALGVGQGALLGVSEGTEAAAPFLPDMKPVDAYAAAILDTIEVTVV